MKRTPIKGKLDNFFSSLGKQLKAGQKDRGIFSEKSKAEKKSRKAGESKFQADVRRKGEKNRAKKAENKADAAYYGSNSDKMANSEVNKKAKTTKAKQVTTAKAKAKVSYADAYKNADKKKYPTLALFTAAAKEYNANKKK